MISEISDSTSSTNKKTTSSELNQAIETKPCEIHNGIFHLNGEPQFMVMGEYPYYRDKPNVWEDRLQKMKQGGIKVIAFAIPWRHHVLDLNEKGIQTFDFDGKTQHNRNLHQFLKLIEKFELFAFVKLGPFIQSDVDYGGLPDFVNPENNSKISPMYNYLVMESPENEEIAKARWPPITGSPLPSPINENFLRLTKDYFSALSEQVLISNYYPKGPIILLQLWENGIYSAGDQPLTHWGDYSKQSIKLYHKFLKLKYPTLEEYNSTHRGFCVAFETILPPKTYLGNKKYRQWKDFREICDWSYFGLYYYANVCKDLKSILQQELSQQSSQSLQIPTKNHEKILNLPPILLSWPAPKDMQIGLDIWASRLNIEELEHLSGCHFGFSNSTGPSSYKNHDYIRNIATVSRQSAINIAQNWGFSKLKDFHYKYSITPVFQTLLTCASGAKGFTIQTCAGTSNFGVGIDANLDSTHDTPYPRNAPIRSDGELTQKFFRMTGLNKFFGEYHGKEFLDCRQEILMGFAFYSPYAKLAAFAGHDLKVWQKMGLKNAPVFGQDGFSQFLQAVRNLKQGYKVINLETLNESQLQDIPPVLIFVSSKMLSGKIQILLIKYIHNGGLLCLFGELPEFDEKFQPNSELKDLVISERQRLERSWPKRQKIENLSLKKQVFYSNHGNGGVLFSFGNPFLLRRRASFYLADILARSFRKILRFKFPGKILIKGRVIPYSMIFSPIFNFFSHAHLQHYTMKVFNRIIRFLQIKGIHRRVEISVKTDFLMRDKIDVFLLSHPEKDVHYVFVFSKEVIWTLPVSIHCFFPENNHNIRIKTKIVGHASHVYRIENGNLTSFVYTGVNPFSYTREPVYIKINKTVVTSSYPLDLICLYKGINEKKEPKLELYTANHKFSKSCSIEGLTAEPIELRKDKYHYLINTDK